MEKGEASPHMKRAGSLLTDIQSTHLFFYQYTQGEEWSGETHNYPSRVVFQSSPFVSHIRKYWISSDMSGRPNFQQLLLYTGLNPAVVSPGESERKNAHPCVRESNDIQCQNMKNTVVFGVFICFCSLVILFLLYEIAHGNF